MKENTYAIDLIINSLSSFEDKEIRSIDFNEETNEIFIMTKNGDYTISLKEGIPNYIKQRNEEMKKFIDQNN